jgi:DNA-directed RNA polymerase II subunit RPB2
MTPKKISKELHRLGYHGMNEQRMICGMSGELIEGNIFMGPIFYQRMKQMAVEKAHARSTGSVVQTTRQPREGRSNLGGLRLGEMEQNCVVSHGASSIIQERLMVSSDPYKMYVCDKCGNSCTGNADEKKRIFQCDTCGNKDTTYMSIVEIPYAAKLLYQEVTGLRVNMKIETENNLILNNKLI